MNIKVLWACVIVMIVQGAFGAPLSKRAPLIAINTPEFEDYRRILQHKLLTDRFDVGRTIVLPFAEPENVVSIYSIKSSMPAYRISYVESEQNLWQLTDGGHEAGKAKHVKVRRIDADLPESTARLLRSVWQYMLANHRSLTAPSPEEREVIPGDSTRIEWWLEQPQGLPVGARLNQYLKHLPKISREFLMLSDVLLVKYCKAEPNKRVSLLKAIDQKAISILRHARDD